AAATLSLADLGADTSARLDHPDLAVRVAAALRADDDHHDDERVHRVLLAALHDPEALAAAFDPLPPQLTLDVRFAVVERVTGHARSFDELLPAALAVLPHASLYTVDHDWGLFLRAAHRLGERPETCESLRTYLAALVARDDLWKSTFGNALFSFQDAALPYDRAECARLANVEVPPKGLRARLRRR
ncbi:MAG: hypothetical protein M3389_14830, partial [Actinomycetota bacterium]|nr:hypothetical protein [Actinomycetota bacterium]